MINLINARIYNFSGWIFESNPILLKDSFSQILKESGFDILNFQEHYFKPKGYTALWLLGESHFALHTFPEEDKTYIELSSCNQSYFQMFKSNTLNLFSFQENSNEV
jgi:S-adenosylmethionine decarboxylase